MKKFVILSILLIMVIVISITYTGLTSSLRIIENYTVEDEKEIIYSIRESLESLYSADDKRGDVEKISKEIDRLYAGYSKQEILKSHLINRSILDLILMGAMGFIIGAFLWFGIIRLITNPIGSIITDLDRIKNSDWRGEVRIKGAKEIKNLQKNLNRMVLSLNDYREKVKTIERENLGSFITHKIKNSLTPIQLCAYNIRKLSIDESVHQNADLILDEIKSTEQFISQLKLFIKTPKLNREDIEVSSFLKGIIKRYESVDIEEAGDSLIIKADRVLLEEVLINLIQNGLDATHDPDDRVIIRVDGDISVIDRGIGISSERLDDIFNEYYTTKQKGMGLGLAYVKRVVDAHGYSINVKSQPGEGTEIRIGING